MHLLPKHLLSLLLGWLADCRVGIITRVVISLFIRYYRIDMEQAIEPNPQNYSSFNDFFTRKLNLTARPLEDDKNWLVLPVDGVVSQIGNIRNNELLQAKGHKYTLLQLLAGDQKLATLFQYGKYATFYLSPRDYHRVHMPCDGKLHQMIYVPGELFAVNAFTASTVPNLFARNERVICIFDTAIGTMAQILIGAVIVGSIAVSWSGQVKSAANHITYWNYVSDNVSTISIKRGMEMGYFKLGSTVINLFPSKKISFSEYLECGTPIKLGEKYAKIMPNFHT